MKLLLRGKFAKFEIEKIFSWFQIFVKRDHGFLLIFDDFSVIKLKGM